MTISKHWQIFIISIFLTISLGLFNSTLGKAVPVLREISNLEPNHDSILNIF